MLGAVISPTDLYGRAVTAERQGQLNDALRDYRAAFKKDPNVDKHYHQIQVAQDTTRDKDSEVNALSHSDSLDDLVFSYQRTLQLEPDYERQKQLKHRALTRDYAQGLLTSFRDNPYDPQTGEHAPASLTPSPPSLPPPVPLPSKGLLFYPKNSNRKTLLSRLPDELLLYILSFLCAPSPRAQYPDVRSLERGFSLISRKARLLTLLSPAIYRVLCDAVYRPPTQIEPSFISASALSARLYGSDWRFMWIEHPRIRTDGVYISQITYLRKGAQEGSSYFDPTHCVTYYRYLCFLPNGHVVSLLSHDVPAQIVPNLLSSSHSAKSQAGYTVGRWRLRHHDPGTMTTTDGGGGAATAGGSLVHLSSLEDPRIANPGDIKYSFKMSCRLKSTTRGRMNKLEMINLIARNHRTGEEAPIPIEQPNSAMPSFYFSRVLSYD
ncbi:MAG: hypothetical protein CYPHOPRED_000502 [Cyphobasidiales sp. Tagirdzhanova-0007]|nr:MAG: hypothetical protein CYPHOPRED_000502 [Cyphobasidiales sp. Tagirdzhanova-0007]